MIEQQQASRRYGARLWDKLVRVAVELEDEEQARVGAMFNSLMIVAVMETLALSIPLAVAWIRGYFSDHIMGAMVVISLFALLPVSLICFAFVKRGYLRPTIPFYVWFNLMMVLVTGMVFGGSSSVGWFMLLWPITLAITFMKSGVTILFTIISVITYSILIWAQDTGRYISPLQVSRETPLFLTTRFYWIMLIVIGGIVNFLNVTSLHKALDTSRKAIKLAENTQLELEDRVAARTATLTQRTAQFQTIAELGRITSSVREEQTLLDITVNLISEQMGFYHVAVFLIDPTDEWALLRAASSEGGVKMLAKGHRLRVGQQGVVGYVSRTGLPRFAFDVGEDAVWIKNPDLPETKSEIALPLTSVEGVFGVLDIQTRQTAAFDEQDVDVLRVLADNVAIAIVNSRLLRETQLALERLERYQKQDAVRAWQQALTRRNMKVGFAYQSGLIQPLDNGIPHQNKPDRTEAVEVSVTDTAMHRLTAMISVGGRPAGHLIFERATPWSVETIQLVESVVTQLDLALTNARLLEETRLRASQEAARSEIIESVRALTSTDAIMRKAAEELGRALRVERSRIQLVQFKNES
jgi:GAF domain-containing protein